MMVRLIRLGRSGVSTKIFPLPVLQMTAYEKLAQSLDVMEAHDYIDELEKFICYVV
jgi:hypothetical protein